MLDAHADALRAALLFAHAQKQVWHLRGTVLRQDDARAHHAIRLVFERELVLALGTRRPESLEGLLRALESSAEECLVRRKIRAVEVAGQLEDGSEVARSRRPHQEHASASSTQNFCTTWR